MQCIDIEDVTALRVVLCEHGIEKEPPEWLVRQVLAGDCGLSLIDNGLMYVVQRAKANVYRTTPAGVREMLYEVERIVAGVSQQLTRSSSVSEKIKFVRGETPAEAMIRCLADELGRVGVTSQDVRLVNFYGQKTTLLADFPIPAVAAVFLHEYEIPYAESRDLYEEVDGYKTTRWEWRPMSQAAAAA